MTNSDSHSVCTQSNWIEKRNGIDKLTMRNVSYTAGFFYTLSLLAQISIEIDINKSAKSEKLCLLEIFDLCFYIFV